MFNESIFIFHSTIIAAAAVFAVLLGPAGLTAFICVQCLLANLFVIKQTTLFGLAATCADPFTIGATLGLNLLQEYFGKQAAKRAIWTNFFLLVLYALFTQIHLVYLPHAADSTQLHFSALLSHAPRIIIASFSVYLVVQLLDYQLYGFFKRIWPNRFLILRNYLSIIICQLIDTVLFSFLGLYGIVDDIWHIIVISYAVKLLAIIIATPLVGLSKKIAPYSSQTSRTRQYEQL